MFFNKQIYMLIWIASKIHMAWLSQNLLYWTFYVFVETPQWKTTERNSNIFRTIRNGLNIPYKIVRAPDVIKPNIQIYYSAKKKIKLALIDFFKSSIHNVNAILVQIDGSNENIVFFIKNQMQPTTSFCFFLLWRR